MISDWVVVVDGDKYSEQQKQICHTLKPDLKGMINCNDIDNTFTPTCMWVQRFPAFCHVPTNSCVYGVRDLKSINELPSLVSEDKNP